MKLTLDFNPDAGKAAPVAEAKSKARHAAERIATKGSKLLLDFRCRVFMRDRTHTYLWLRDGRSYGYFLTLDPGSVTIVKVDIETEYERDEKGKITKETKVYRVYEDKEHFWDLVAYPYDFVKAVEKYHTSHLGRSAAAEREMRAILGLEALPADVTDEDLAPDPPEPDEKGTGKAPNKPAKAPGGYTLQSLCLELKLDPTEARKTLRSKKVEKPGGRWEWPSAEAAAAVRAILSAV